jgi:hypothetical protein
MEVDGHVAAVHPELLETLSPLELAGRAPAERAVVWPHVIKTCPRRGHSALTL